MFDFKFINCLYYILLGVEMVRQIQNPVIMKKMKLGQELENETLHWKRFSTDIML